MTARTALAKQLQQQGEAARAAKVLALRRPALPLWAVNQAARAHPRELQQLYAAGDRLKAAHAALLKGGDAQDVRGAGTDEQEQVSALVTWALATLPHPGAALRARIEDTFRAVARGGADERTLLEAGALDRELTPGSAFAPSGPVPRVTFKRASPTPSAAAPAVDARKAAREEKARLDALREKATAARHAADAARSKAERLSQEAEHAELHARQSRAEAATAAAQAATAARAAEDAQAQLDAATS